MAKRSWTPVLRPGLHREFLSDVHVRDFAIASTEFETVNALILGELTHWIYRRSMEADQSPADSVSHQSLAEAGLKEKQFLREGAAECALIEAVEGDLAMLVFKGTSRLTDWLANFDALPTQWSGAGRVHRGFQGAVEKIWDPLASLLKEHQNIFYTGHSLGAALATLTASLHPPTALYTFGSPRVGDDIFADSLSATPIHRVVNAADAVPRVPPAAAPFLYAHVGQPTILSEHQMDANAQDETMDGVFGRMVDGFRQSLQPPDDLWDHAPANYVRRLHQLKNK